MFAFSIDGVASAHRFGLMVSGNEIMLSKILRGFVGRLMLIDMRWRHSSVDVMEGLEDLLGFDVTKKD